MEWRKKVVIVTISCFVTLLFAILVIYFSVIAFQDMAKDVRSLKVITKAPSPHTGHSQDYAKSKESEISTSITTMETASEKRYPLNYAPSKESDTSTYTITKTTAFQQSQKEADCVLGPFGGKGAPDFSDRNRIEDGNITGLYIKSDQLQIKCVGFIRGGVKNYCFGGTGPNVHEVKFKAEEYITGVNGGIDTFIYQITFITNLNSYGPYGRKRQWGHIFSTDFKGRSLEYISGRSGLLLIHITFHLSC